jgi:hypothetical protein
MMPQGASRVALAMAATMVTVAHAPSPPKGPQAQVGQPTFHIGVTEW